MIPTVEVNPSSTARVPTQRVFRIVHAATHHRVDIDMKLGVFASNASF